MTDKRRVVAYLRTPVAAETEKRQETVLARLETLAESGIVRDAFVRYWNRLADLSDAGWPFEEMETWATDRGVSLEPAFDRHTRRSGYTGISDEVLTLPVVCVTVLEGETIVGVYPHLGPDGCRTVGDCLDQLESEPSVTGSA